MSIGLAVSKLFGLDTTLEDVAYAVRRGLVTALGLYACKFGGFIVEGGFRRDRAEKMIPPLIFRGEIPDKWLFVVALPTEPWKKVVGFRLREEDKAIKEVYMQPSEASYLSRLVLMKIIPSFVEKDIKSFGEGLTEFNRRLGYVWSKYQGGIYCDPIVEKGIEIVLRYSYAACQSSWGPTFYGILDDEKEAEKLAKELRDFIDSHGGGYVYISRGWNRGSEVIEYG